LYLNLLEIFLYFQIVLQFEVQVKASDDIILYSSLHHCEQKSTASNQQVCYIKEEGRFDLTLERSGTYCFALYTGVS